MQSTLLISARRSAVGRFGGALKDAPLAGWGGRVLASAVTAAGISSESVEHVVTGRCFGTETRRLVYEAGIPDTVVTSGVYQACASGLVAVHQAHRMIQLGEADVVVAGGVEQMSAVPFLSHEMRWGARLGDAVFEDWIKTGLNCPVTGLTMGCTAENIRRKHGISRADQDTFACQSQERAAAAIESGKFRDEIEPLMLAQAKAGARGQPAVFDTDEHPRPTDIGRLAALPAIFEEDGTVTAGNASGINDGAAYMVLTSEGHARARGLKPLARIVANASAGLDPALMGLGPVPAMRRVLDRAGMRAEEIDLYEINEAFAVQVLGVLREFPIPMDKLNVNGGAIALGHPVGCSGARILVTLVHELRRRGLRFGMASLCVGGGMGAATIVEAL